MTTRSRIRLLPIIIVGVVIATAGVSFNAVRKQLKDAARDVTLATTWGDEMDPRPGPATMIYNLSDGHGDYTVVCRTSGVSQVGCRKGGWSKKVVVGDNSPVLLIITADKIVNTTCAIRAASVRPRPPAVQPAKGDMNPSTTRQCTAIVK
jgi:hypothetical protein